MLGIIRKEIENKRDCVNPYSVCVPFLKKGSGELKKFQRKEIRKVWKCLHVKSDL